MERYKPLFEALSSKERKELEKELKAIGKI